MKVAVSADGDNLDAMVDPRFGRCGYFIIVETEDLRFQAVKNENASLSSSAGIQASSFVASQGVKAILTGNCGPKAMEVLIAGGIEIFTGQSGTVRDTVKRFQKGDLPAAAAGEGGSLESARGTARKMGMGQCGGRGMGGGSGMAGGPAGFPEATLPPAELSKKEALAQLKTQAAELQQQMEQIKSRIEQMEE